jgi:DNA invertase Pin-like site-specific DNA recombinase
MKIGYARVSTDDQQLHLQLDALTTAGCTQIFHDEGISGVQVQRPGLDAALAALAPSDVLVVWRLDRLGRSMPHLVSLVHTLGMQAARRRGQHLGRPRKLTREQVVHAARMVQDGTETVSGMAALYGVDRVTLHRALKRAAASDVRRDRGASFPPRPPR